MFDVTNEMMEIAKEIEPYINLQGGMNDNAPNEIKVLYQEFLKMYDNMNGGEYAM